MGRYPFVVPAFLLLDTFFHITQNISAQLRASVLLLLELLFLEKMFSVVFLSSPEVDELLDYICIA